MLDLGNIVGIVFENAAKLGRLRYQNWGKGPAGPKP